MEALTGRITDGSPHGQGSGNRFAEGGLCSVNAQSRTILRISFVGFYCMLPLGPFGYTKPYNFVGFFCRLLLYVTARFFWLGIWLRRTGPLS